MKDLGRRLRDSRFEASALDGHVRVSVDGLQRVRQVEVDRGALEAAGGRAELAEGMLSAMQEAHDSSYAGTRGDVWQLYRQHPALLQAPLTQIGFGDTIEDPWANVTAGEDRLAKAAELFEKFDADGDGYWNFQESSQVQLVTEGVDMTEEGFSTLVIGVAPNGGRDLTEEMLAKGLSKEQVVDLYTNRDRQRQLGLVLDIERDHAAVFRNPGEKDPLPTVASSLPGPD